MDKQLYSIDVSGKKYSATLSMESWTHGICVLVTMHDGGRSSFSAKVMCSASKSDDFEIISNLPQQRLLDEAWAQFKEHYSFKDLDESLESGVVVLLPWR